MNDKEEKLDLLGTVIENQQNLDILAQDILEDIAAEEEAIELEKIKAAQQAEEESILADAAAEESIWYYTHR